MEPTTPPTARSVAELRAQRYEQIVRRMNALSLVIEHPQPGGEPIIVQAVDPIGWGLTDEAVGRTLREVLPHLAGHAGVDALTSGTSSDPLTLGPLRMADPAGTERDVEVEAFALPGGACAVLLSDVTEREAMLALMRHRASHDELTGLANRAKLRAATSAATKGDHRAALLVVDLNDFKGINDGLGHEAGDHYLTAVSGRLTDLVSSADTVARLGGDEFAILLVSPGQDRIDEVVAATIDACRRPVDLDGVAIASSASIGIALAPEHAMTADDLLRCADAAMYDAKRSRAGSRIYEPHKDASTRRLEFVGDLTEAFADGQFEMLFQAKVEAVSRQLLGVEALVRWNHPAHGQLLPDEFLELVAIAGFSDELFSTALRQAIAALAMLPRTAHIAVNLTAHDVRSPSLPGRCKAELEAAGIDPSRLTLELTESHILDTTGVVQDVLAEIAAIGIQIAVDDFGTGYSSFSNLRALPINELKIDKSFVQNMITSPQDLAIVRSVIELGHNLRLTVTAEGVEDGQIAQWLTELGCDQLQGYYLGRPFPESGLSDAARPAWTGRSAA